MKNNINKKVGATLLAAAIMAGTAVIPMSNAAVEAAAKEANKPSIQYRVQVQDHAWMSWVNEGEMAGTVGESRRMETLQVRMLNCEGVSLKFYAHIQDLGDCYFTDKDEYVGTVAQSKRVEAIGITSEGLKEKGYQLQYRVQVQDIGWMPWVNDGEVAGTRYQSKRLETIEIRVVPIAEGTKAEYMLNLTNYDVALAEKMGEDTDEYKEMEKTIATAIANINKAETDADAKVIYDAMVASIKEIEPKIETKTEAVLALKATVKANAEEKIKEYLESVKNIIGLDAGAQANLNLRISTASASIAQAKSPSKITEVINELDELINENYPLEFAKTEAVNALNEYATADVSTGVKSYIAKQVKDIKDVVIGTGEGALDTAIGSVGRIKTAALANVRDLIADQEFANKKLDIYEKEASKLGVAEKAYVLDTIKEYRTKIDKIEIDKSEDGSTNYVEAVVAEFTNLVSNKFNEEQNTEIGTAVDNVATENALKLLINAKKSELDAFVESQASTEEKKLAKEYIKEYVDKLDAATSEDEVKVIMYGKNGTADENITDPTNENVDATVKLAAKIQDTMAREQAYTRVIAKLNQYKAIVPTLKLSNESYVLSIIENTRTSVENAKTAPEIIDAENRFDVYMEELKLTEYYDADAANQNKATTISKLQKYTKSSIPEVAELATNAIDAINDGENIESTYTTAMNDILDEIKLDAYSQLRPYNDTEKYGDAATEGTVNYIATTAQNTIIGLNTTDELDYEDVITRINSTLKKAKSDISGKTTLIEETEKTEFNNRKSEIVKKLNEYADTARKIKADAVVTRATRYSNYVNAMNYSNTVKVDDLEDQLEAFTNEIEALNDVRSEAFIALRDAKATTENFYSAAKTQVNGVITSTQNTIYAIVKDTETEEAEIDKALSRVTALVDAYATETTGVYSVQKDTIDKLNAEFAKNGTSYAKKEDIRKAIADIKAIKLDISKLALNQAGTAYEYDSDTITATTTAITNIAKDLLPSGN